RLRRPLLYPVELQALGAAAVGSIRTRWLAVNVPARVQFGDSHLPGERLLPCLIASGTAPVKLGAEIFSQKIQNSCNSLAVRAHWGDRGRGQRRSAEGARPGPPGGCPGPGGPAAELSPLRARDGPGLSGRAAASTGG